jgi:hypothetical protein
LRNPSLQQIKLFLFCFKSKLKQIKQICFLNSKLKQIKPICFLKLNTITNQTGLFFELKTKTKQIKMICFLKIKTKTNEICFSLEPIKASLIELSLNS